MQGVGPAVAFDGELAGLPLEQRLALIEQQMIALSGVLHRLREELDEHE